MISVLYRSHLFTSPLISVVIVITYVSIDFLLESLEAGTAKVVNIVLEMTEEGFLRGIIPTVTSSGHGLTKLVFLEQLLKGRACIVAALVGMDKSSFRQFKPLLLHQFFYGICR